MNNKIFDDVQKEMERQDEKWGMQSHNLIEWVAILTEEVGEVAKEATDFHFANPMEAYYTGTIKDRQAQRLKDYRKELIQVAAVAVQAVRNLDECL